MIVSSGKNRTFALMKTQVIISNQHDPFLNRAVESYLVDHQGDGVITLYLWKNQQTVVIGYNQNPYSECNVQLLLDEGGHLMRRGTGGGAVYHDLGNINFSFIVGKKDYDVKRQLSVIQDALLTYGLPTDISGRNDLTFQGRKFSGNAFSRGTHNNLHHGTILIKTDGEKMRRYLTVNQAKLMKNGVRSVASRIINLSEVAPELTSENITQPLIQSFEKVYGDVPVMLDFEALARDPYVQAIRKKISSYEFLFSKWEHFKTSKRAQFPWGGVEIALHIDEAHGLIKDLQIASDCLDTDIIGQVEQLLRGANTHHTPDCGESEIMSDIVKLIYN